MLIDSHTHLNLAAFDEDRDRVFERARAAGVEGMIVIGFDLETIATALELVGTKPGLWATAGFHPHEAGKVGEGDPERLERLGALPEIVAIGETGLDFYRDYAPREAQREVFRLQIRLANRLGKPLVIHCRDAHEEVVAILKEEGGVAPGGVFHAFGGDRAAARDALDLGFHLGIGGPLTFKNSRLGEAIREVPLEKILLETDCPWLAPHPHRGKRNEPAHVALVARRLAEIRDVSYEEVAAVTSQNTRRLFGLGAGTPGVG